MSILVRRSNLLVSVTDADAVGAAWRHNADAITLDLKGVPAAQKTEARRLVKSAIAPSGQGATEVFVRVNKDFLQADLEASVWAGLRGIVLPGVESAAEVVAAAELVTALEAQRDIKSGSLQFIVMLESARGVWDVRAILAASPRITQVALNESGLAADLGIKPLPELDPFDYARGRVIVEATAARVNPVGIAYPLSVQSTAASAEEIHAFATKGKNLGMKGVLCPQPDWVAPVNAAFTPTPELVVYNKRVRVAFAVGIAAGTAAVPLDGRMIDVPVDEWAIVVLATAEACAARDAEKKAAMGAR